MIKKLVLVLTLAAAGLVAVPSQASAAVYDVSASKSNTYGLYTCRIKVADNRQSLSYSCTVLDKECDDHGVYVSIRVDVGRRPVDEGSWDRKTGNAGGCGKSSSRNGTIDSGVGPRDIDQVSIVLTRDDSPGYDDYYWGTRSTLSIPYA